MRATIKRARVCVMLSSPMTNLSREPRNPSHTIVIN
jgi:hypothetical protein